MSLFQPSVLRHYLKSLDERKVRDAYERYRSHYLAKKERIEEAKEEQYQYGFFEDLFVKVLGYTLYPSEGYDLITEQKNRSDARKADGAILRDGEVIAVVELKSTRTRDLDPVARQAFGYKLDHPTCRYVITSNFQTLRLYVEHSDRYESFDLFEMDEEAFARFYGLLSRDALLADKALELKRRSKLREEEITDELYRRYADLRAELFADILARNPQIDRHLLLQKTQTILDRMVFIFFAEDRGILPPNTIASIIERYRDDIEDRPLWHFYKIYFRAIHSGNAKLNIPAYNGGLFAPDELIDSLEIGDEAIEALPLALSAYDFNTEVDVNILGHIFENSLSDIEELKARLDEADFDPRRSRRKKEGVFYTPEWVTRYIVAQTLGALCESRKRALGLWEAEIPVAKNPKRPTKEEKRLKEALESYREYLLGLKILDPACGSGAFLNQALGFLLAEHAFVDEGLRRLMGGNVLGLYDVKKEVLERNLYGVDINAEAVEIAKLSLWLRTVEPGRRLDRLSEKIRVGDSLVDDAQVSEAAFDWEAAFAEVFEAGGFDVVVGNPPYVRQELLDPKIKNWLRSRYATWHGTADLYVFFVEKGFELLKEGGKFGYIFPNKWMRARYGEPLRRWLGDKGIEEIIDFGDLPVFEEATTYPMILRLQKGREPGVFPVTEVEHLDFEDLAAYVARHARETDQRALSAEGWSLAPVAVQRLMAKLQRSGVALGEYLNGEIYRGVLTGLNDAFVVDEATRERLVAEDPASAEILKPFLAGRDIKRYETPRAEKWLILFPKGWTRERSGMTEEGAAWTWLQKRYPAVAAWLEPFADKAKKRSDKGEFWWELRACDYYRAFEKPKIFYPDISIEPSFMLDEQGFYAANTAYMLGSGNRRLLGILNSSVVGFYLRFISNSIRGGYIRYFTQAVETIPLPSDFLECDEIEKAVDQTIQFHDQKNQTAHRFLRRLRDNLGLEKPSKKIEKFWEYDFKTLLSELKKRKITLSLGEQDEWEAYFDTQRQRLLDLERQIAELERSIDRAVYGLYGLSDEEIAVVEGGA